MKVASWIFVVLLLYSAESVAGAGTSSQSGLLDFIAANRERQFNQVAHEVLAFYYTWYGRPEHHGRWVHWGGEDKSAHEIPESTHYPARGAYDSHDPDLIAAHIDEAKSHGVTGFIATWWGQRTYDDRAFEKLLDCAEKKDFKVTIYWETAPGRGDEQIERAVEDLVYVVKEYGNRSAFLKVDGKPVIFVYGRVMNDVPLVSWPAIIQGVRSKVGDCILIADGYTGSFVRILDGVHTYNNCAQVADKSPDALRKWSASHYADAVALARRYGKISCATVIPGYDDRKIRKPGLNAARQNGETYRVLWEEAIKADPDWVLITSWNEWHEGSEIEPSFEDGGKYLKLTADYAPRFLAQHTSSKRKAPRPAVEEDQALKLQRLFKGRTIGLLPDFGDPAFWLLDAGVSVRPLSWADITDPAILNPDTLPVLLHAGGEHYSSNGKSQDDVLPALQRYLREGGFLISMPSHPFPFYYDDATGHARVIAHQIGLPVQQGWEQPPSNADLRFRFDTNALPGLPAMASFPVGGDLRWRPASRDATASGDTYLPLSSLVDQNGQFLGEGIAYLEHRAPPLQGGRTLYVWMRMGDVAGENELMTAVFQFVGEHLQK